MDPEHLTRLLGSADLEWLVQRIRRRVERGEPLEGAVTLGSATPAQREAVQRLLGRAPRPGKALTVSMQALDTILRSSGACTDGLAAAVAALAGPIPDRRAEYAAQEQAWTDAFAALDALVRDSPELAGWQHRLHATGLVRRLTGSPHAAAPLLAVLARVIAALPGSGEPLGQFAARLTGSAHGLDDGQPLGTLALSAARAMTGLPDGSGADARRETWASVGVLLDDLSTTALTFALPGDPATSTGRALGACREAGQPVVLTLRQLVRDPPVCRPVVVHICENPVVVAAAADRLGALCRPLVCTRGQPSAAVTLLLRILAGTGAELRYHGDFDWGGLRIANVLFDRLPVQPWRFTAHDYRSAAPMARALSGRPVEASWDPDLTATMRRRGTVVEEETVLDPLLADLAADNREHGGHRPPLG